MRFDIKKRIFGAYVLVLGLGIALAAMVILYGTHVRQTSQDLISRHIPELQSLHTLKLEIVEQESLLYGYAATGDRRRFLERYERLDGACAARLEDVGRTFGAREPFIKVQNAYGELRRLIARLDERLRAGTDNEQQVRPLLSAASAAAREINNELDALISIIRGNVQAGGARTGNAVDTMRSLVLTLGAVIFVISLFVGYYINAYINEQTERRRLAMFPERNPNPILSLSRKGAVLYANPAAAALLARLGGEATDARALLPADLNARLDILCRSERPHELWSYTVGDRFLECGIHFLADLDVCHAYISDVTERRRVEEQVLHQAYHDALTGLPNRRMFEEQLEHALHAPRRGGMRAAALLMGVDRFRVIIASLGHALADALLQAVSARLERVLEQAGDVAPNAALYRFEGDRFAVLIPGFAATQTPVLLAERILFALRDPLYVKGREYFVGLSIGISIYPLDGQDSVTLLKNAETAMFRAKQQGGTTLQCYTADMNARAAEWLSLENHLRHAEELDELRLYYHPQIDIRSGHVIGVEALLRWQHPQRGLLTPAVFMPLAEESGLITAIGDWALRTACAQTRRWHDEGLGNLTVAVNISGRQFAQEQLAARVAEVLAQTGLPPEHLELEITETVAMQDVARTISTLRELKTIGVRLSVDDFGTGFSSLGYLKRFPIDKLKVDQSFVRHLTTDENDAAITRAVITLGHSLRLKVIAEGVETPQQLAALRRLHCDEYQGYLFSKPMPPESLARTIAERSGREVHAADTTAAGRR